MGQLYGVTIEIEGASMMADFEVIEIVDDSNPYPALLGLFSLSFFKLCNSEQRLCN